MSTIVVTERTAEASPRLMARIAGGLYLSGVANLFAGVVLGSLVVNGDAVATAHNILAHETFYRLRKPADRTSRAISLCRLSSISCLSR